MLTENFKLKGDVLIEVFDPVTGEVKDKREIHNLLVDTGLAYIASRMVGTASGVMSHMAVGTSGTSPAAGNTTLGAEVARQSLTSGTAASNVVTYVASFAAGVGTGALQEAGMFNASSGGTMLCRTTFAVVNKGASDAMTITWTVTAA
jgi:hypothetical protein